MGRLPRKIALRARERMLKSADRLNQAIYPELRRFATFEEREDAMRAVARVSGRQSVMAVMLIMGGAGIAVAVCEGTSALMSRFPPGVARLLRLLIFVSCTLASVLLLCLAFRNRNRRELRRVLLERGIPVCIKCGYDLTGNISRRCPECGEPAADSPRRDDPLE